MLHLKGPYADHILIPQGATGSSYFLVSNECSFFLIITPKFQNSNWLDHFNSNFEFTSGSGSLCRVVLFPMSAFRDAPLDFQGGRKFYGEKKIHPRHEDEKKNFPLSGGVKKIHPCLQERSFFNISGKKQSPS